MLKLGLTRRAKRDLAKLPDIPQRAVLAALRKLVAGEYPSADIKKLRGYDPPQYRLRVGSYRVIFRQDETTLNILRIGDRKDIYR